VTSAALCANHLHLAPGIQATATVNMYRKCRHVWKFWQDIFETRECTDIGTDRHTHCNTFHPYCGRSNNSLPELHIRLLHQRWWWGRFLDSTNWMAKWLCALMRSLPLDTGNHAVIVTIGNCHHNTHAFSLSCISICSISCYMSAYWPVQGQSLTTNDCQITFKHLLILYIIIKN